jgi:hypothetical protein
LNQGEIKMKKKTVKPNHKQISDPQPKSKGKVILVVTKYKEGIGIDYNKVSTHDVQRTVGMLVEELMKYKVQNV